MDMTTGL